MLAEAVDYVLSQQLRKRFGFDAVFVTVGMALSIAAALVLGTAIATYQVVKAARAPILKLMETKAAPELTLQSEHLWHLFLSHVWATGQAP